MAPQAPTYVASSGQLTDAPLTKRIYNALRDYGTIAYLFVDTLVTPILNPNTTANTSQELPRAPRTAAGGTHLGGGGGSGGSGGGSGGRGGGSGFMTMSDLRGGQRVDACRAASCG